MTDKQIDRDNVHFILQDPPQDMGPKIWKFSSDQSSQRKEQLQQYDQIIILNFFLKSQKY